MRVLSKTSLSLMLGVFLTTHLIPPSQSKNETPSSAPPKAQKAVSDKFALLVGINDYPPLKTGPEDKNDLHGCLKDVADVKSLLCKRYGFKNDSEHITILTGEQATREAILKAFQKQLIANSKKYSDGTFVFHYSGHGLTSHTDYDEDETDKSDECIVPVDLDPITDDEIGKLCDDLTSELTSKSNVTLIFDCCHSGTITRGLPSTVGRSREFANKIALEKLEKRRQKGVASLERRLVPASDKYFAISACNSMEKEYETNEKDYSKRNGLLTRHLVKILTEARDSMTNRALRERLLSELSMRTTPQADGSLDRKVLSGNTDKVDIPIFVTKVDDTDNNKFTIKAGRAQGVRQSSVLAVYDESAERLKGNDHLLGLATITEEGPTTSVATMRTKVDKASLMRARVALLTPGLGSSPLKVKIDTTQRGQTDNSIRNQFMYELKTRCEKSDSIDLIGVEVADGSDDPVIVRSDKFSDFSLKADLEEPKGEKPDPSETVFYLEKNNQPLYDFWVKPGDATALTNLFDQLERTAAQESLLKLINDSESTLNGALEIKVKMHNPPKSVPDKDLIMKPGESLAVAAGDKFDVIVTNVHPEKSVFVNVLLLDNNGGITPAYKTKEALKPNDSFTIKEAKAEPPLGMDTFKFFVTETDADFGFLRKEAISPGTRSAKMKRIQSGLPQLLFGTMNRYRPMDRVRSLTPDPVPPMPEEWGVQRFDCMVVKRNSEKKAKENNAVAN